MQLGPNVSIGAGATIGPGVRIRESIVLQNANISEHSLVLHSIVGRGVKIGAWTRVEGTPNDPNPNKPFAKMDNPPLFNSDGRLNPSVTILGRFSYPIHFQKFAKKISVLLMICTSKDTKLKGEKIALKSRRVFQTNIKKG